MRDCASDGIIHKIAQNIIKCKQQGTNVTLLWIPAHSKIKGNIKVDKIAKTAASLNIGLTIQPLQEDIKKLLFQDYRASLKQEWPYFNTSRTSQKYFEYVDSKTERPWFCGYDAPRDYINLITRLRTGHICTGSHFRKMGWNIPPQCKCGHELSSLKHYIQECELFNEGRLEFLSFLQKILGRSAYLLENLKCLVFFPNLEIITEIGKFLTRRGIII